MSIALDLTRPQSRHLTGSGGSSYLTSTAAQLDRTDAVHESVGSALSYDAARARRAKRWQRIRSRVFMYIGIILVVVWCLAPGYWMVVSSLRRTSDIFSKSIIPMPLSWENYKAVLDPALGFGRSMLNSLIVASLATIVALALGITCSYALARLHFRGKGILATVIISVSMFPTVALIVPLLKMFTSFNWINTYQALVLPNLSYSLPLAVWTLTSFFRQMPEDLENAAMIDGCTRWQAFRKIILPVAAPGIFTTAIITFFHAWNEFLIAVTLTNKPSMQTATVAVSKFTGASEFETPFGTQMAAGAITIIPLIIIVLIFQRRIISGLAAGAEK